ncbi:MAG TPA: L-ribulose-5-phosphate 3-epimerase [Anaerolineales bacterium]|nr:L-ribulose-5-phosphate 3-epimerase [Anaerolineales bacterium]
MANWQSNLNEIPFGLYEKALPQELNWEDRLNQARKAGFNFVEMSVDDSDQRIARLDWNKKERSDVREAVDATGVPIRSMSLSVHRRFPLGSLDSATRKQGLENLNKAIDLALDLNLRFILLAGAENYYQERTSESKKLFLEAIGKGFERASRAGMMLALENWDIQINSLMKVMEYVKYFNSPWFQAYVDIGNLVFAGMGEKQLIDELALARGHIAALHVKDTLPGHLRYIKPGEGKVPFVEAFAKIAEIGFQGPVVLELWTEEFPNALDLVREAIVFVKEKMQAGWQLHEERQRTEGD